MTRKNKMNVLSIVFDITMVLIGITVIIVGFVKIDFDMDRLTGESNDAVLEERTENFSASEIKDIIINCDVAEFKINASGESNDITVKISDNSVMRYTAEVRGKTLNIKSKSKLWHFGLFSGGKWWNIFDNSPISHHYSLEVTVPLGYEIDRLDIDVSAGSIRVSDITANNFYIENNAGETIINNVRGNSLTMEQNAGSTNISNADFRKMYLKNNAGKITTRDLIFSDLNFSVNAGDVDIHAIGKKAEYTIDVDSNIGNKIPYQTGTTAKTITGNINAGNVYLEFSENVA